MKKKERERLYYEKILNEFKPYKNKIQDSMINELFTLEMELFPNIMQIH